MSQKKTLSELTLLDRFLFAETMENPENLKIILDIILEDDILLKGLPQTEKELRKATEVFIVSVKLVSVNKYLKEMTSEPAE